jgi:hypothetical protein
MGASQRRRGFYFSLVAMYCYSNVVDLGGLMAYDAPQVTGRASVWKGDLQSPGSERWRAPYSVSIS